MRIIISLIIFSVAFGLKAEAQQYTNEASAIVAGGGGESSATYSGNITIGLPFVGEIWNALGDTTKLGMYDDTLFNSGVAIPPGIQVMGNIYPNPSDGSITIPTPPLSINLHASLYDERGAFVLDATPFMARENDNFQFTLHTLSSGSYMLTLDDGKERYSYKLSIRN